MNILFFKTEKIFLAITIILFFQTGIILSQPKDITEQTHQFRYWIFFKDKSEFKPEQKLEPGSNGWDIAISELTNKAIDRRKKNLPDNNLVGYNDLPVSNLYINKIEELGFILNAISKWFNAVSVTCKKEQLDVIKKLDFVTKIEGVKYLEFVRYKTKNNSNTTTSIIKTKTKYDYGLSYWQNEMINVPILHNYGVTGNGIIVGMCDDGFNWRQQECLKTRKVIGEYDWIFKDDSVQNQIRPNQYPDDHWDQDGHGTATMSTLGGFYNGKMIGPSFNASFYLSKTEDNRSETPIEEDFWISAIEWMESKGVDVVSSSLIYKNFDEPNNDYTYEDMNGKTTMITRAADIAFELGVIVCNSMGNERQTQPPSIVAPSDGNNVISVGAVDSSGKIAYFSSNGPTNDGRIKPDVVAMGMNVWTANSPSSSWNDSSYYWSDGTSFSSPLTAGVCALILSAHPYLTSNQVREALKMTANNNSNPNNVYGWGLVNAYDAVLYFGMFSSNLPEVEYSDDMLKISIYFISRDLIDPESVKFYYNTDFGNDFKEMKCELIEKIDETNSGKYSVSLKYPKLPFTLKIYFKAADTEKTISSPYGVPERYFYLDNENLKFELY